MAQGKRTGGKQSLPQLDSSQIAASHGAEMRGMSVQLQFTDPEQQHEFENYQRALHQALAEAGAPQTRADAASRQIALIIGFYSTAANTPKVANARLKTDLQRLSSALIALNEAYASMSDGSALFVQKRLSTTRRSADRNKVTILGEPERREYETLKQEIARFSEIVAPLAATVTVKRGRTRHPDVDHVIDMCVENWAWATGELPTLTTSTDNGEAESDLFKLIRDLARAICGPRFD